MNSNNFENKKLKILDLYKKQKFAEVIKIGSDLHNSNPNDHQVTYILGLAYVSLKNFIKAEKYFGLLIPLTKSYELYYIFGNIQKKLKKYKSAITSFENAIELKPDFSEAYNSLGNAKKLLNFKDEAEQCYRKAISLKEDNIEAYLNLSNILKESNKYQDLILIYQKILKLDENNVKTIYNLGSAYLFLGEISKAREYFKKAISINQKHLPSYRNYISVTKIDEKNDVFKKLVDFNFDELNVDDKILSFNALSKSYFDLNNIDLGFNYLNKSNLLKKEKSKFSMKDEEKKFMDIKLFFKNFDKSDLKFDNNLNKRPIFIVGMPRSGTTLIEQILSSHSKIHGAGELNYLQKIIDKLGLEKPTNFKDYFSQIREFYNESISKISKKNFIIDKMPANFRWIGFIFKSLPEAKIIHIDRNPMAVCWSNYKTFFVDSGMDFNLSQKDVAYYYSIYADLMKFWKQNFQERILDVNYENFVQDYEENTKKILSYLDLNWENTIRNYDKNDRVVTTASYNQVRRGIKKNTSEEWKKHKDHLKIMQETLKSKQIDF